VSAVRPLQTPQRRPMRSDSFSILRRVFWIDVLVCTHCGGPRRLLAAIHDPESIRRVIEAMRLPTEIPVLAPARAPPEPEWLW
jgi:hypothetical protein